MLKLIVARLAVLPAVAVTCLCGTNLQGADTPGRLTVRPVNQVVQDSDAAEPAADESRVAPNPGASLLDDQKQMIRLLTEKLRNEVSNAVEMARRTKDPETGLGSLKQTLGAVKTAIDIAPEDRQRMTKQLEAEILQQSNLKELRQQTLVRILERRAQEESRKRLAEQSMLD